MDFKKIGIITTIIIGTILFYKFVPLSIKKFLFFIIITLTLFIITIKYLIEKTGGTRTWHT